MLFSKRFAHRATLALSSLQIHVASYFLVDSVVLSFMTTVGKDKDLGTFCFMHSDESGLLPRLNVRHISNLHNLPISVFTRLPNCIPQ
jgi:hypothetical protein